MNSKNQKITFGIVALLGIAFLANSMIENGLLKFLALAFVVALLTLPITWKLLLLVVQAFGLILSLIGHGVGRVGDVVGSFAVNSRQRVSAQQVESSTVPSWDELRHSDTPSEAEVSTGDVGLDILGAR